MINEFVSQRQDMRLVTAVPRGPGVELVFEPMDATGDDGVVSEVTADAMQATFRQRVAEQSRGRPGSRPQAWLTKHGSNSVKRGSKLWIPPSATHCRVEQPRTCQPGLAAIRRSFEPPCVSLSRSMILARRALAPFLRASRKLLFRGISPHPRQPSCPPAGRGPHGTATIHNVDSTPPSSAPSSTRRARTPGASR